MARPKQVPIIAYHSIADEHQHLISYLSLPISLFERQLQYLARTGFETVTLYDVYAYLHHGASLPRLSIALTFDDGYLDNWVYAFPLLKKYGMRATIFVATDFIDPRDECRPTVEDVWAGRLAREELTWWGHLSWPELRVMQASGLVDIQAQTRTHAWLFTSDRIVDFHHPTDTYYWLDWNRHPLEKHSWLTRDHRASVPLGTPVYEFAPALLKRRYSDDPAVAHHAANYVAEHGGPTFFDRQCWRDELRGVVSRYAECHGSQGRYETDTEYTARVSDDMAGSRRILIDHLDKSVDFLCWPCGDYTARLQQLAIANCGYRATVNVNKTTNRLGDDPTELRRIVFGQDYAGLWRQPLIFMNFCGNVNYYSGRLHGYPAAPIARRLMRVGRLFKQRPPVRPSHN